jgi:hypothetical protein
MKVQSGLVVLGGFFALVNAHGDEHKGHGDGDPNANYAQRHVSCTVCSSAMSSRSIYYCRWRQNITCKCCYAPSPNVANRLRF